LRRLRRTLGSRGERAYLAILEPGQLSVIPVALSRELPKLDVFRAGTSEAITFFSRLSLNEYRCGGEPTSPDFVYDEMFTLLQNAADELTGNYGMDKEDVLSLVGRALFFRFLCDRQIVKAVSLRSIASDASTLTKCFDTPNSAASTCAWLDITFNGDFLPLTEKGSIRFFEALGSKTNNAVFRHLSAILHGHEPSGSGYQLKLDLEWAKFDFAHVPVGLLSQVYEAFCWRWSPDAKGTSVHYTPRRIADYLVEEAFHGLTKAESVRILDPACGAGVFLVLAFRRVYQARWKAEGSRPDTKAIRNILETQLAGFDVSEPALRLAALSLYLTAIELDPEPVPPSKLKFKNLRGRVLFNYRQKGIDPDTGPVLGSLGEQAAAEHASRYDVIMCNPPWTSLELKYKKLAAEYTKLSRDVLERRGLGELGNRYENPDNVPDLAFVWRATEWCRPDGRICMILPGRNLFKQEPVPRRARDTLFRALAVNGIVNCSNLSDTQVWPEMNQPFFLLFARNRKPKANHILRWVTPHCDVSLNRRGEVRVDSESVELVSVQESFDEPWLWKALAIGTSLDLAVVRKIKAAQGRPLQEYWESDLGLVSSNGYQIKAKQPQTDASALNGLPDLSSTNLFQFLVDVNSLLPFRRATLFRPRNRSVYNAPLAIVKGFPGQYRENGFAWLSLSDIAYKQNFFGYSGAGRTDGEALVRYLQLFVHSSVWMHLALMCSPKLGVERREFYKTDLDESPIIPWEAVDADSKAHALRLSDRLISADSTVFEDIDAFFATLYGLNRHDVEVIKETLETALPYNSVREQACKHPTTPQKHRFASRLESVLRPFVCKHGKDVQVTLWSLAASTNSLAPYSLLLVGTDKTPPAVSESMFRDQVLPLASESGASRVLFEVENGIAVGILNQQRYWTRSRARLCAAEIVKRHMSAFR
jgi:hypothetical protein